ncbi:MAG: 50S ribosomal protein L17 [Gemmatimonadota bacterium]
MDHRKLRRNPSHRKALMRNLMNALVRSERVVTTVAKAKELRRLADRLITLGKRADTHARRLAFSMLSDKENTEKIFAGLAGRFVNRHGGYTRIVRTGYRAGDGSDMAILEYLPAEEKKAGAAKGKKKGRAKAAEGEKERGKSAPRGGAEKERKPARKPRGAEKAAGGGTAARKKAAAPEREPGAKGPAPEKKAGTRKSAAKKSPSKPE